MNCKKFIHKLSLITCSITMGLILASPANAAGAKYSDLIIFSGSLSDTGNLASLIGDFPPPFYNNRSSNGPVAVDILAKILGFDAEPSLHLINKQAGNNYAVKGSTTLGIEITDLPAQLDAYFTRSGGVADPNTLYFVFIGGRDMM